ncbi:ABC transporter ATP-binding protein [Caldisalinibacter kiritimatiensis]|uniref:Oligopeptide transport ATP-binding protein OppF n=1 Tax=Caldisalinibacter kiritimatiensis TaxID=1304284 RepID=R1ATG9_9FIRM|nr:ABC transporter ATP-binding protein [Caldisalinibacter kiritimatiensis]EOD00413.1 Oligopeptide transport ATP-binding protein OppF [Caldisalinibacter kiritimatiensis]
MSENSALLKVNGLKKYFPIKSGVFQRTVGYIRAVDGVDFEINKGETMGLVGESGCGKSTIGRTLLRLLKATDGEVLFQDKSLFELNKKDLRKMRTEMQIVFQDPYSSLNPRMTVGEIVGEAIKEHKIANGNELVERVIKVLERCGLSKYHIKRYPHEFSGGQRQRICIARALALEPEFIVADEAVSALDVSIQSQIINLLMDLQEEMGLTYLFISHDLSVVRYISDKIAVMYLGKIVEYADKNELFENPIHPYTKALLSAIPISHPRDKKKKIILEGDIPSAANPPTGCRFHTRCPYATKICKENEPQYKNVGNGHYVACHLIN